MMINGLEMPQWPYGLTTLATLLAQVNHGCRSKAKVGRLHGQGGAHAAGGRLRGG
jgi:hypothetical protein